jgi:hypothetical protein
MGLKRGCSRRHRHEVALPSDSTLKPMRSQVFTYNTSSQHFIGPFLNMKNRRGCFPGRKKLNL